MSAKAWKINDLGKRYAWLLALTDLDFIPDEPLEERHPLEDDKGKIVPDENGNPQFQVVLRREQIGDGVRVTKITKTCASASADVSKMLAHEIPLTMCLRKQDRNLRVGAWRGLPDDDQSRVGRRVEDRLIMKNCGLDMADWQFLIDCRARHVLCDARFHLLFYRAVIETLRPFHDFGFVHCDLKLDNICWAMDRENKGDTCWFIAAPKNISIIDLGAALGAVGRQPVYLERGTTTEVGIAMGEYVSPNYTLLMGEVAKNHARESKLLHRILAAWKPNPLKQIDWRIDFYSLGCLVDRFTTPSLLRDQIMGNRTQLELLRALPTRLKAFDDYPKPAPKLPPHRGLCKDIDDALAGDAKRPISFSLPIAFVGNTTQGTNARETALNTSSSMGLTTFMNEIAPPPRRSRWRPILATLAIPATLAGAAALYSTHLADPPPPPSLAELHTRWTAAAPGSAERAQAQAPLLRLASQLTDKAHKDLLAELGAAWWAPGKGPMRAAWWKNPGPVAAADIDAEGQTWLRETEALAAAGVLSARVAFAKALLDGKGRPADPLQAAKVLAAALQSIDPARDGKAQREAILHAVKLVDLATRPGEPAVIARLLPALTGLADAGHGDARETLGDIAACRLQPPDRKLAQRQFAALAAEARRVGAADHIKSNAAALAALERPDLAGLCAPITQ